METFATTHEELFGSPAPVTENPQLAKFWGKKVSELCELEQPPALVDDLKERHRIYSYLLMAIIHHYWNGFKRGRHGEYPWNDTPGPDDPSWMHGEYRGHNIAALAVDADGHILDFDFNHNELFNSSAEHAEARLVRRLYSLAQISDSWTAVPSATAAIGNPAATGGHTSLSHVTIYTSLESCSQCSGVMALAQVREVIYLQTDPMMYFIGRILRNLTTDTLRAPLPIGAGEIDLRYFEVLNSAYSDFSNEVATMPFWRGPNGKVDNKKSVTSFLCTGVARTAFAAGGDLLSGLIDGTDKLRGPEYRPRDGALTNRQVVGEAQQFLDYARRLGRRATPHNL
jgi:tRNA(Arg) A34 adenosine deaminase TadA